MSIENGRDKLRKCALEYKGTFFRFAINPQNLRDARPHRSTVVKTKQNIDVQDFGPDIGQITITGVTGVNRGKGYDKMKELRSFITNYQNDGGAGVPRSSYLRFHNFTNGESWKVTLNTDGFSLEQDANDPLQYTYTISLLVLSKASLPSYKEVSWVSLGNKSPSIGGGLTQGGAVTYYDRYSYSHGLTVINPSTTNGAHKIAVKSLKAISGYQG